MAGFDLHAAQDEALGVGGRFPFPGGGEPVVQHSSKRVLVQLRQAIDAIKAAARSQQHGNDTKRPDISSGGLPLASRDLAAYPRVNVCRERGSVGLRCLKVLRSHIGLEFVADGQRARAKIG